MARRDDRRECATGVVSCDLATTLGVAVTIQTTPPWPVAAASLLISRRQTFVPTFETETCFNEMGLALLLFLLYDSFFLNQTSKTESLANYARPGGFVSLNER